jgi:hypothetical protein
MFRRALYPTGTSHILPVLEIEPAALNFGSIDSGSNIDLTLRLRNVGPGLAWGKIYPQRKNKPGQTGLASAVQDILAGGSGEEESSLPGLKVVDHFQGNNEFLELNLDTARVPMGSYASHLVIETDGGVYRVPVSYTVVPLELRTEPAILDLGAVRVGRRVESQLAVLPKEATVGKPRGTIYTGASLAGLTAPERFEGTEPFPVVLDAGVPSATARSYDGLIQIDTNGGRLRVPVRYRIVLPPEAFVGLVGGAVLWGGIAGAAMRLLYYLVNPEYTVKWLLEFGGAGNTMVNFQFRGLGPLLAGAAAGLYGGWWYGRQQKKLPKLDRTGPLRDSDESVYDTLPMFGLFFGAFGGYLTAQLLHWTFWSLGDWLLYPLTKFMPARIQPWMKANAPGMWLLAGGTAGLVWGVGRIITATGRGSGRWFSIIVAAVVFLVLLLNAMLSPV